MGARNADSSDHASTASLAAPFRPRELATYLAVLASVSVPVAVCVHTAAAGTRGWVWPLVSALCATLVGVLLLAPGRVSPGRAAAAAGCGAGVLVGVALALFAPAYWISPDTAFHMSKVAVAAEGHAWQDPILRTRTIYPFMFHWLLAWPVRAGVPLRTVMTWVSAVAMVGTCASFWWAARAHLTPSRAAWAALALPLFFHAPSRGYVLLPDPSNVSWVLFFTGVGLLLRTERNPDHRAIVAGAVWGVAGLIWYGHLPFLALLTVLLLAARPKLALRVVAGAAPWAVLLAIHLLAISDAPGGGSIVAEGNEPLTDRLAANFRNLLGLSGGGAWSEIPWWIGLLGVALVVSRWRAPGATQHVVLPRLVPSVAVCLGWAGLQLRYWEPFAWRYAYLLWVLLLLWASDGRCARWAGRELPATALAAALALALVPGWLLPVAWESERLSSLYERSGEPVAVFLEANTDFEEIVFASVATWERAIGCCVPRPNLVGRGQGIHNYAPAALVEPRFQDYISVAGSTSPAEIVALLEPYGIRYALVHVRDQERPGMATLASSFEVRVETEEYRVVDLQAPRSFD